MKKITILITMTLSLLLQGCTPHGYYDRDKYREWYNKTEKAEAKKKNRKPKLIYTNDTEWDSLIRSIK